MVPWLAQVALEEREDLSRGRQLLLMFISGGGLLFTVEFVLPLLPEPLDLPFMMVLAVAVGLVIPGFATLAVALVYAGIGLLIIVGEELWSGKVVGALIFLVLFVIMLALGRGSDARH